MLKNFKRNFLAVAVSAFVLLLAFPLAVSAASLLSVNVDNTSITSGQTVNFSIRTTPDANYVFAEVGANTVQATRLSEDANGNQNWSLAIQPTSSANIAVFASTTNSTANAASFSVPVTVTGAATPIAPITPLPAPVTPAQGGPIGIHSISETPALAANQVQLTVVVGPEANEVWVRFDNDRFRRGQEQTALRTADSRTFVINFQPTSFTSQQVVVSANRTYSVAGASNHNYTLTLAAPFVRAANPSIQQVSPTPSNRTVSPGSEMRFVIRTNADVNYVWVTDVDGNRHNATRTTQGTATTRNWNLNFNPVRTGAVTIRANSTNTDEGAATRTENITVRTATATIRNATAHWTNWNNNFNNQWNTVRVQVTTNYTVDRVWVELQDGRRPRLNPNTTSGTSDRTWTAYIDNVGHWGQLSVRASTTADYNADASQTVSITGNQWGGNTNLSIAHDSGGLLNPNMWLNHHGVGNNQATFHFSVNNSAITNVTVNGVPATPLGGNSFSAIVSWWANQGNQLHLVFDGHGTATVNVGW